MTLMGDPKRKASGRATTLLESDNMANLQDHMR
jgi:hypothetical protein